MDKEGELVFVYGTLRVDASNHHRMRGAQHVMRGLVKGRLYQVDWYPAFVADESGYDVEGDVFRVDRGLLAELDRFEGLDPGALHGEEYERVKIRVRRDRRGDLVWRAFPDDLKVWVWVWRKPVTHFSELPSGNWLNVEGAASKSIFTGLGCLGLLVIPFGGIPFVVMLTQLSIVIDVYIGMLVLLFMAPAAGLAAAAMARHRRERAKVARVWLILGSFILLFLALAVLSKLLL